MEFFNKKEEVLDIQLTQYGKHLLSRGDFKPEYYMFFDDDILYDSTKAHFSENQNDSENRILNNTPKLKTLHTTSGVELQFLMESEIEEVTRGGVEAYPEPPEIILNPHHNYIPVPCPGEDPAAPERWCHPESGQEIQPDEEDDLIMPVEDERREGRSDLIREEMYVELELWRNLRKKPGGVSYEVQEKILLYPMYDQEITNPHAPSYDVIALDTEFKEWTGYQKLTESGILKNIPQIKVSPNYTLTRDARNQTVPNMINSETFVDVTGEKITFQDQTTLQISRQDIVIDIQEINTFDSNDNFIVEVYEVIKRDEERFNVVQKIQNFQKIQNLFQIITDESLPEKYNYKDKRQKNTHRRGDSE